MRNTKKTYVVDMILGDSPGGLLQVPVLHKFVVKVELEGFELLHWRVVKVTM
jgi:hypothetical protein